MTKQALSENPVEAVRSWLLGQGVGELHPIDVAAIHSEDVDGREAWYFVLILPEPSGDTWDPAALSDLRYELRDKALEVGLPYPWYLVPRTRGNEIFEDDEDLPTESS